MLETPHAIVAAAIAVSSGNPLIALPLSLLSHFVLDEVPHWNPHLINKEGDTEKVDPTSFKIIIIDSSLALISGSVIAFMQLPDVSRFILVYLCCFLAVLPDLVEAPYIFLNYKKKWLRSWLFFQKRHQFNIDMTGGLITQFLTIAASIWWILQK